MKRIALLPYCLIALLTATAYAAPKEKERKTEHNENKIVVKERDKGSTKEIDWKVVKEVTLMFKNNRKGRKPNAK